MDELQIDDQPAEEFKPSHRRLAAALALILLGVAGVLTHYFLTRDTAPETVTSAAALNYETSGDSVTLIEITPGDTLTRIGTKLVEGNVVKTVEGFNAAANNNPDSATIQPGYYTLTLQQPSDMAIEQMLNPNSRNGNVVTIAEGLTVQQTLEHISSKTNTPLETLQTAERNLIADGLPYDAPSLEGFLTPGTYPYNPSASGETLLKVMLTTFTNTYQPLLDATDDPYATLIAASIIEEEAGLVEDQGKVAAVIWNRLNLTPPMKLQMDSTINYARTEVKEHLNLEDLKEDTLYNTYQHEGLPPTPISSPSKEALQAAINPEPGEWLYFVASGGGASTFTITYDDFLQAKQKAQQENVY